MLSLSKCDAGITRHSYNRGERKSLCSILGAQALMLAHGVVRTPCMELFTPENSSDQCAVKSAARPASMKQMRKSAHYVALQRAAARRKALAAAVISALKADFDFQHNSATNMVEEEEHRVTLPRPTAHLWFERRWLGQRRRVKIEEELRETDLLLLDDIVD